MTFAWNLSIPITFYCPSMQIEPRVAKGLANLLGSMSNSNRTHWVPGKLLRAQTHAIRVARKEKSAPFDR